MNRIDKLSCRCSLKIAFVVTVILTVSCSPENDYKSYLEKKIGGKDLKLEVDSTFDKDWMRQYLLKRLDYSKSYTIELAKEKVNQDSINDKGADDSNYIDLAAKLGASRAELEKVRKGDFENWSTTKKEIERINSLLQDPPSYHKFIYTDAKSGKSRIFILRLSKVPSKKNWLGVDTVLRAFEPEYYRSIHTAINSTEF